MDINLTDLDQSYLAMMLKPEDDRLRLHYYDALADSELFVLLEREPKASDIDPKVFALEGGPLVLVFDVEERLSAFTGAAAPYAALPGRVIATALVGQGVGLGINLGVASAMILPPSAVQWLADTLAHQPAQDEGRPKFFHPPQALPAELMRVLTHKLSRIGALADYALLGGVEYEGGRRGHLLAFVDANQNAEAALAKTATEALTFSGLDAGTLDVTFLASGDRGLEMLKKVGQRVDWSKPQGPSPKDAPSAPGSNPKKPPILRQRCRIV